jgi:hypothetical protein
MFIIVDKAETLRFLEKVQYEARALDMPLLSALLGYLQIGVGLDRLDLLCRAIREVAEMTDDQVKTIKTRTWLEHWTPDGEEPKQ